MKINIHETLMNLNRGRITVDQAHDEIESAMCEADACAQLSDVRELVEMVEAIPCICEECYTSRKLTQPDCPRCNYIDMDIVNKVKAHF